MEENWLRWERLTPDEDDEVVAEDAVVDADAGGPVVLVVEPKDDAEVGSAVVAGDVLRLFLNTPKPPRVPNRTARIATMATALIARTVTDLFLYHGRLSGLTFFGSWLAALPGIGSLTKSSRTASGTIPGSGLTTSGTASPNITCGSGLLPISENVGPWPCEPVDGLWC